MDKLHLEIAITDGGGGNLIAFLSLKNNFTPVLEEENSSCPLLTVLLL